MKFYSILLLLFLTGCATNQVAYKRGTTRLSGLDAERYQAINLNKFDNETTSCGKDKLLRCLGVQETTCHKIYRAAAIDCFVKFYEANGNEADVCDPSNKGFIDGCMYKNVLKYGKGGMSRAKQCMEAT